MNVNKLPPPLPPTVVQLSDKYPSYWVEYYSTKDVTKLVTYPIVCNPRTVKLGPLHVGLHVTTARIALMLFSCHTQDSTESSRPTGGWLSCPLSCSMWLWAKQTFGREYKIQCSTNPAMTKYGLLNHIPQYSWSKPYTLTSVRMYNSSPTLPKSLLDKHAPVGANVTL